MRVSAKQLAVFSLGLVVVLLMVVVVGVTASEAQVTRFVGTATLTADGVTFAVDFLVTLAPPTSFTWEWSFRGVVILSGVLSGTQVGSNVSGTLFAAGLRPCHFTGVITGNRVDGTFDPVSCGGTGTFVLFRQ